MSVSRWLYLCIVGVYLLAFPYHPKLRSPNELCRLWQSRALVEYGSIELNQALRDFGYVGDLSVKDGKYYPSKAPLLSFAAAPIYWVLKQVGGPALYSVPEIPQVYFSRLFLTVLPTLLMLIFLRRFLKAYVSDEVADLTVVTYALGSMAFSYSLSFMSHQTTAVLVFGAFYNLWRTHRNERKTSWGYLSAGAYCGSAIACEYTAALPVALLALWELGSQVSQKVKWTGLLRTTFLASCGALPFVVALMAYHQAAFGHPLESGYKYLNDAAYQGWHVGGFLGIRLPDVNAFFASYFSPLRGFFTTSPFLFMSIPGLFMVWRREKSLAVLFLLQWLGFTYFTSSFAYESWGWTTGPRHMTSLLPFLLMPVAVCLEKAIDAAEWMKGAALGLCAVSVLSFGAVVMVNYIPDTLSTALFGAALPLMKDGYFTPSLLLFWGVPNPISGAIVYALVLMASVLGVWHLRKAAGPASFVSALLLVFLSLMPLWFATRQDAADAAAVQHLENSHLAPPGKSVLFWSPSL